jgi:hypothetical protein
MITAVAPLFNQSTVVEKERKEVFDSNFEINEDGFSVDVCLFFLSSLL